MTEFVSGRQDFCMTIGADLAEIGPLLDQLSEALNVQNLPDDFRRRVMLAIEEIAVNAIMHGDQGQSVDAGASSISVSLMGEADKFVATIAYDGSDFDSAKPVGPQTSPAGAVGGHGLFLAQTYADRLEHRHDAGHNIVNLEFDRRDA